MRLQKRPFAAGLNRARTQTTSGEFVDLRNTLENNSRRKIIVDRK
jgi:hypothetical protein